VVEEASDARVYYVRIISEIQVLSAVRTVLQVIHERSDGRQLKSILKRNIAVFTRWVRIAFVLQQRERPYEFRPR
jgi:hypothetical protein